MTIINILFYTKFRENWKFDFKIDHYANKILDSYLIANNICMKQKKNGAYLFQTFVLIPILFQTLFVLFNQYSSKIHSFHEAN